MPSFSHLGTRRHLTARRSGGATRMPQMPFASQSSGHRLVEARRHAETRQRSQVVMRAG